MSTGWILWILLSFLTGSPITALVVVLLLWWLGDRFTFRLFPDVFRAVRRWRRRAELEAVLQRNPSDRRARFELGQLLLDLHRPSAGLATLRPNLEAGDDDVHTAFLYGALLARSGEHAQAERILGIARAQEPDYRLGEIDLELGRSRLAAGDLAGAREALERFVAARPGTVQGRWLLSQALAGLGDREGAARTRQAAWREYVALPRFRRPEERLWAWRARPSRPIAIGLAVLVAVAVALAVVASAPSPHPRSRARVEAL
jgi:tetratricopeptide (TPR) repeat protein